MLKTRLCVVRLNKLTVQNSLRLYSGETYHPSYFLYSVSTLTPNEKVHTCQTKDGENKVALPFKQVKYKCITNTEPISSCFLPQLIQQNYSTSYYLLDFSLLLLS